MGRASTARRHVCANTLDARGGRGQYGSVMEALATGYGLIEGPVVGTPTRDSTGATWFTEASIAWRDPGWSRR